MCIKAIRIERDDCRHALFFGFTLVELSCCSFYAVVNVNCITERNDWNEDYRKEYHADTETCIFAVILCYINVNHKGNHNVDNRDEQQKDVPPAHFSDFEEY